MQNRCIESGFISNAFYHDVWNTLQLYIYITYILSKWEWHCGHYQRDWGSFLTVFPSSRCANIHLLLLASSTRHVWSSRSWRFVYVDLWVFSESPRYSRRLLRRLTHWREKQIAGSLRSCRDRKKGRKETDHTSRLDSHIFILCSRSAAIFLFMFNRCIVVDLLCLYLEETQKTHAKTLLCSLETLTVPS